MMQLFRRSVAVGRDERGIALVTVIGVGGMLAIMATTLAVRSVNSLDQVGNERRFEQALHVADSAIDRTLSRLTRNPAYSTGEALPAGGFASPAAEEAWVHANLNDTANNPLVRVSEGEWQVVKPIGVSVIYSVGYVPTKATPGEIREIRVIRAEYDFPPFVPGSAVLVNGNLNVTGGSSNVNGDAGSVHANGSVNGSGNAQVTASGYVSAAGSVNANVSDCPNGSAVADCTDTRGSGRSTRELPPVRPREQYGMSEYDLCPDGTVRAGPKYVGDEATPNLATNTPCGGGDATLLDTATTDSYRGWRFSNNEWVYNGERTDESYDGIYYVFQRSVEIKGNPGRRVPWRTTILAESVGTGEEGPTHCNHSGGDIRVTGTPVMRYHPDGKLMLLVAGRDLSVGGNPGAGSALNYEGLMAAHEQFSVTGNPTLAGVLVAEDLCHTAGSPVGPGSSIGGNVSITYNGDYEIPVGGAIRTTLWQEP